MKMEELHPLKVLIHLKILGFIQYIVDVPQYFEVSH